MRRTVVLLLVLAPLVYLAGSFLQVWWASRSDYDGSADAIVVLGAAQYDGQPSPVLRARLDHAAELYIEGRAPVIVLTGGAEGAADAADALVTKPFSPLELLDLIERLLRRG